MERDRDLITNLSSRQLTDEELQALSLGLKFDTGRDRRSTADYFVDNQRQESEVERGFTQGLVATATCLKRAQPPTLPMRYEKTLKRLGRDSSLHITKADKGGGVIVMQREDYDQKMTAILADSNTYQPMPTGSGYKESQQLKQRLRRLLLRTDEGKRLLHLLPDNSRISKAYGLPKTHKPGVPLRPIISGIGSVVHQLAKVLARPLSRLLGKTSGAHLRNSNDLLERLGRIGFRNIVLASFDVKSLFTNVPCDGAMQALDEVLDPVNSQLPLPRADFITAVSMCVRFGSLEFNGKEFRQHHGLAMGSPLSPVLACLYMESLEKKSYLSIVGPNSTWLRYVDDVLLVVNQRCNLEDVLKRLNAVEETIQFTLEKEEDNKLAFLDTMIHRSNHGVSFSVYRKPTNKDDFVHFFSGHSQRVKTGTAIGFYLRAFRICSPEHLGNELKYIMKSFMRLGYPESLMLKLEEKARLIRDRSMSEKPEKTRMVILPSTPAMSHVESTLMRQGLTVAHPTGRTIKDLVNVSKPANRTDTEGKKGTIYRIPCSSCSLAYIGETGRGLKVRLREHQRDLATDNPSNALVQHARQTGHYPNLSQSTSLQFCMEKTKRRALEAAYIQTDNNALNTSPGFYIWASAAAKLALNPAT